MNPRVVVLVALIVLAAGLAVWLNTARPPAPRAVAPAAPAEPDSGVIARALQNAEPDSAAIKSRWIDDLNGMDVSQLAPGKRMLFLRYANSERCTCGCGYTLAGCRQSDMDCSISGPHLAALLDSVRAGRIRSADGLRQPPSRDDAVDDD
ncbi:MAG TPA: hypothetical protein VFK69_00930 [Candidatus Eisenbacteria bacterium]|nr:hypothetical protein [Candidatus Eisenbacteria bacterium]